jgi:hybrid cluster-associated redox disulfide protein
VIEEMAKDKINGEMSIVEIVQKYPETAEVFLKHGMHCIGCAAARFETLAEGAMAHGIDMDVFLKDLNKVANKKKQ